MPQTVTWFVPGRVELLGKHTDYAGGRSLLAAVDRGHTVAARAREDRLLRVTSAIARETIEIDLDAPEPAERMGAGHWSGYVRTVVDRLRANFPGHSRGADIQVESDLPLAAGMSSSSALVVGLALAFGELCGMQDAPAFREVVTDRERLAEYLGCVENGQSYGSLAGHRGVGTFGGSEDHVAMLCGRADEMVQYAFCPVRSEASVPFPEDRAIVMAVSGVQAEKTGSALERYNRVSLSARDIVGIWNERTGRRDATLGDIVTGSSGAADELRGMIDPGTYLMGRLVQFLEESERIIPAASDALATGDLATFGSLVDESQQLAEEGLGNQTPETVALQRLARELGADAASAFGAGFGGSVWAMVPAAHADSFAVEWLDRYADAFPVPGRAATWLVTRPGPPAHRVEG
ncbi:galactokinase [Brachybacterium endophyticum]|uniref:Galactokinase n=1 Tax=Brachybacterium endophyticum TaxID=2182385 RepID=A0A2U2RPV5_9MICO|nr:galactokinase [Brachybacterium endophyticum]